HGTLQLDAAGSFTYTPALDFNGADSFTYVANDGVADSSVATVSLTMAAVNDAPVAADVSATIAEDTPLTATLGATDVDSALLTSPRAGGPLHGTLLLGTAGSFTYTPVPDFNGADGFTYVANDGLLDSNAATVSLTVTPVNDAPVGRDDVFSTDEDTA